MRAGRARRHAAVGGKFGIRERKISGHQIRKVRNRIEGAGVAIHHPRAYGIGPTAGPKGGLLMCRCCRLLRLTGALVLIPKNQSQARTWGGESRPLRQPAERDERCCSRCEVSHCCSKHTVPYRYMRTSSPSSTAAAAGPLWRAPPPGEPVGAGRSRFSTGYIETRRRLAFRRIVEISTRKKGEINEAG